MNLCRISIVVRYLAVLQFAMVMPLHANEWDATWAGDSFAAATTSGNFLATDSRRIVPQAGGWIIDTSGRATRLSADGGALARSASGEIAYDGSGYQIHQLADGGALVVGSSAPFAHVTRINSQGKTIWGSSISPAPLKLRAIDNTGALWWFNTTTTTLNKLAPDGVQAFSLGLAQLGLTSVDGLAVSPSGNMALLVGRGGTQGDRISSVRLSRDGSVLSQWNGPTALPGTAANYLAAALDDGHALLMAFDAQGHTVTAHHDAQGVVTMPASTAIIFSSECTLLTTSGGFVLATDTGGPFNFYANLQFLSPSGELLGAHTLPDGTGTLRLAPALDGAMWVIGATEFIAGIQLYRVTADAVTPVSFPQVAHPFNSFYVMPPTAAESFVASEGTVYRASLSGQLTPLEAPQPAADTPMERAMATTDGEGNAYVMQRRHYDTTAQFATLSKISRSGDVQWSVPVSQHLRFTGDMWFEFNSSLIAANSTRVCYYSQDSSNLYCHLASNGAPLGRSELPLPVFDVLELTADNHALLRRHLSGAEPDLVLTADNQIVTGDASAYRVPRLVNAAGQYLDFTDGPDSVLSGVTRRAAGTTPLTWQLGINNTPVILPDGQPAVTLLADGSVLLLGFDNGIRSPLVLRKLNADGSLGFTVEVPDDGREAGLHVVGDHVLVIGYMTSPFNAPFGGHDLFAYSAQDGHLQWRSGAGTTWSLGAAFELATTPDGAHVLWWTADGVDYSLRRIRVSDGVEVARSDFPYDNYYLGAQRIRTDAHGTTVLPSVGRLEHDPFAATVRADQEALEGAWYQPATTGQGILFDYLPESRVWFGTWHTTDLTSANSRAALRWFTLQGEANADGTEATLGIYLASGGKFDRAPRVPSTRIGDATLTFDSCSSANLQYRITTGEFNGRNGSIPLRLLTPHSGSCAAIGQPVVGVTASTRNGISNLYSGTWYNPETSGQGLEAAIRPDLGNGTIIAGWFTFDPEAAGDDPQTQHWFTLQGDLSTAANGVVTLPIFRTIGGRFDQFGTRNTSRVGEATWRFIDCAHSQLSYHFDDSDIAGSFAGRIGLMPLQRIGACSAP